MKYIIFIIFIVCNQHYCYSQDFWDRIRQEEKRLRIENRKVNDPIYETGDTLYLFFDLLDSLQDYFSSDPMVLWKLREMTPEEESNPYAPEYSDLFMSEIFIKLDLYPYYKRKPKILKIDDLKKIILTSRKEFMDFYQREYKRKGGKDRFLKKEKKMILSEFSFRNHFSKVYMIIPQTDNTFKMYILTP